MTSVRRSGIIRQPQRKVDDMGDDGKSMAGASEMFAAIAKVQAAVGMVVKGTEGYGYNYVNAATLAASLRGPMDDAGLVFVHEIAHIMGPDTIHPALKTTLYHIPTGEFLVSWCPLIASGVSGANASQQIGSDITYKRRYQEMAMLNIPAGDDADEKRFNAPAKKAGPKSWGALLDRDGCLQEMEGAVSVDQLKQLASSHKARATEEEWLDDLKATFKARESEMKG